MYKGTTLVTTGTVEEVNRAILDLLKKINELLDKIEGLANATKNK